MENPKQMNPYCVQIELTEGCNLRCSFCGLNGIRGKDNNFKFMTMETATAIADSMVRNGWNSRIEFAMHGEPTMNPNYLEIVRMFRSKLPNAYMLMESNGGGLLKNTWHDVTELFNDGLSTLVLDEYTNIKLVPKIVAALGLADRMIISTGRVHQKGEEKHAKREGTYWMNKREYQIQYWKNDILGVGGVEYWDYPNWGKEGNPHQRNKKKRLVRVRPIDVSTAGTHSTLNNHTGCGSPPTLEPQKKRCAKPFREVAVRYDGNVAICCNDWRGVLSIGNVTQVDLHDGIWHSDLMYSIRRKLYHAERDFGPCKGCDDTSYRPGILPDHLGKESMPAPEQHDIERITTAVAKPNLAETFARDWEK